MFAESFRVDRLVNQMSCVLRRGVFLTVLASFGFSLFLTGCGGSGGAREMNRSHLYRVTAVYNMYTRKHRQQAPPDEKAFQDFIAALPERQLSKLEAEDVDVFLTSPRDGERYVILYGDEAKKNAHGVVGYEKQPNEEGKRLLATSLGDVSIVDEAEFLRLTTAAKKKR